MKQVNKMSETPKPMSDITKRKNENAISTDELKKHKNDNMDTINERTNDGIRNRTGKAAQNSVVKNTDNEKMRPTFDHEEETAAPNITKGILADATESTKSHPADATNSTPKILVVGSMNMDYVLQTERLPHQGETLPAKNFSVVFGGKGMNQCVAIKRLGGESVMVGCLGSDSDGDDLLQGLEKEGLSSEWIYRSESVSTGIAFITVSDDGNNTIVVHPGSNHALPVDWVKRALKGHQDAAMLVLQMEIPLEVITSTIETAYKYGIPVVLNPSPFKELPKEILEKVHTLVVNEVEAIQVAASMEQNKEDSSAKDESSLIDETIKKEETAKERSNEGLKGSVKTEALIPEKDSSKDLVERLAKSKIPQIILTKGDQGVYYNARQNETINRNENGEIIIHHQAAKDVNVVDPTAAGDSFLGAYVAGRCRGYSLNQAISYGILAGALAVTKAGAQPSIPSADDLKAAGWTK